jgi:hypothetical protein
MLRTTALLLLAATGAVCQGVVEIRASAGTAVFADESADVHQWYGGAVRVYVTSRLAIEAEAGYLRLNRDHYDVLLLPNVSYDFRSLDKRVIPYVIGGAGYLRTTDRFLSGSFSSSTWVAEGGGGAKIYLTGGLLIAPEFRVGSELHIRAGAGLGYTFSRRP